jgi:GGDEF domain-containing protein
MRRNEYIYKQPFAEMVGERVYRKYAGGDEFLFIVKGEEAHALGFLNALQKRINNEFNPYIAEMLGRPHLLSFHGAIWPMDTDDNGDSVLDHLHECLRIASQPGWESRVWYSGKNSAAIRNQAWVKNIYSEARGLFAKTG